MEARVRVDAGRGRTWMRPSPGPCALSWMRSQYDRVVVGAAATIVNHEYGLLAVRIRVGRRKGGPMQVWKSQVMLASRTPVPAAVQLWHLQARASGGLEEARGTQGSLVDGPKGDGMEMGWDGNCSAPMRCNANCTLHTHTPDLSDRSPLPCTLHHYVPYPGQPSPWSEPLKTNGPTATHRFVRKHESQTSSIAPSCPTFSRQS